MDKAPRSSSPSTSGRASGGGALGQAAGPRSGSKGPLLLTPREFRFTSEVPIWLDYHGKHVTMDQVVSGATGWPREPEPLSSPICSGVAWSVGARRPGLASGRHRQLRWPPVAPSG